MLQGIFCQLCTKSSELVSEHPNKPTTYYLRPAAWGRQLSLKTCFPPRHDPSTSRFLSHGRGDFYRGVVARERNHIILPSSSLSCDAPFWYGHRWHGGADTSHSAHSVLCGNRIHGLLTVRQQYYHYATMPPTSVVFDGLLIPTGAIAMSKDIKISLFFQILVEG